MKSNFFPLGSSQNHLRQVQVDLIDTKICNAPQVYNNAITPTMLCAGSLKGNKDACQVSDSVHKFLFSFYFEIITVLQEVAKIVQRGPL